MSGSTLKNAAKRSLKRVAPILNAIYPGGTSRTRILTYHSVGDREHEMNVTLADFKEQMQWLNDNAEVISVSEAADGTPSVAITFDDGYLDNLRNAAPVLSRHSFPATVYMVSGRAGETLEHDAGKQNAQLMTWDQVRELESSGVTIGGHSLTHARLSTLTDEEQALEIRECTRILEWELGHGIESFAYPYGSALDYIPKTIELVRDAGYVNAVSNQYGPIRDSSRIWELPRIWIDRTDTLQTFARKVSGSLDILALQDSALGIRTRRVINRLLNVR